MRRRIRYILIIAGASFALLVIIISREYTTSPITKFSRAIDSAHTVELRALPNSRSAPLELEQSQILDLLNLLKDHELTTEFQTMCHEPEWELRFIGNRGMSTTATLSLECSNFYFRDRLHRTLWVTIFDPHDPSLEVPRLVEFFESLESQTENGANKTRVPSPTTPRVD